MTDKVTTINQPALYEGRRVLIGAPRYVSGGRVVDLRRDPNETDWPWSVSEWTTNADHVTLCQARK